MREYLDRGLKVTLSTDSWLMSGVSLTDEYWLAYTELGFTRKEIEVMIFNAFRGAFISRPERQALLKSVRAELESIA